MITREEYDMKTREILTNLEEPEAIGKIIDELTAAYHDRYDAADSLEKETQRLKQINERLQRVNGELLMRTGVKAEAEDLEGAEDEKKLDFEQLFDESGELK